MDITVSKYGSEQKSLWDDFIGRAKNSTFLFYRDYMEYHADRFPDWSLLFRDETQDLVAVMPATVTGDALSSHGGLTFGGIISDIHMKMPLMLAIFEKLKRYLKEQGIARLIYKAVPHIYHLVPAEEDLYALQYNNGNLVRRDVSSAIKLDAKLPYSKGRKYEIKQARKAGVEVRISNDFSSFMAIEERVLSTKYNVSPVHTAAEISMLANRFPANIKLFMAYRGDEPLAGVVIYENRTLAHAQYIAANEQGKKLGALDMVLNYLIADYYREKEYFDFGISTENQGRVLNAGLIGNKESFGARSIVHDFYELLIT